MNYDKATTIAFSGHRPDRLMISEQAIYIQIAGFIGQLWLKNHYNTFLVGMAEGFDLVAAEAVIGLKRYCADVRLICVIPFKGQTSQFSDENKKRYNAILQKADEVVALCENYHPGVFHRRNDYLIKHASMLIAYYDGNPTGGTFYTVERAYKNNLNVMNLFNHNTKELE